MRLLVTAVALHQLPPRCAAALDAGASGEFETVFETALFVQTLAGVLVAGGNRHLDLAVDTFVADSAAAVRAFGFHRRFGSSALEPPRTVGTRQAGVAV